MSIITFLFSLDKYCINTLGLVFATAGGCLLWYFVTDVIKVNKKEILAGQDVQITIPANSTELRKSLKTNIILSRIGIFLTILGGVLQICSNYMD